METLEELKAIRDNAPEGKTMTCKYGYYWNDNDLSELAFIGDSIRGVTRSLSDIERIIELMELNQNMHTTVAGYIYGKDWAHWNEFNAGKFKL